MTRSLGVLVVAVGVAGIVADLRSVSSILVHLLHDRTRVAEAVGDRSSLVTGSACNHAEHSEAEDDEHNDTDDDFDSVRTVFRSDLILDVVYHL